jgi:hypothetical protein
VTDGVFTQSSDGSREVTAGTQVERSFRSNALPGDQEIRCPCDVIRTGWAGGGAADTTRLLTGYARFLAIV